MKAMPCRMESLTPCSFTGRPSMRISPASGWYTPPRIFMRVDLPAPFSPQTATTSPRPMVRLTLSRAMTPGNLLEIPRISSNGAWLIAELLSEDFLQAALKLLDVVLLDGLRGDV